MGVLGLTKFLIEKCPKVIQEIPGRFKELSGKTIALDATLITQRFHFAPAPQQYRHVLGWYKLICELQSNNVRAICIFDGASRSQAKMPEVQRRKEVRQQFSARKLMEEQRQDRLLALRSLVERYRALSESEKLRIADSLKHLMGTRRLISDLASNSERSTRLDSDRLATGMELTEIRHTPSQPSLPYAFAGSASPVGDTPRAAIHTEKASSSPPSKELPLSEGLELLRTRSPPPGLYETLPSSLGPSTIAIPYLANDPAPTSADSVSSTHSSEMLSHELPSSDLSEDQGSMTDVLVHQAHMDSVIGISNASPVSGNAPTLSLSPSSPPGTLHPPDDLSLPSVSDELCSLLLPGLVDLPSETGYTASKKQLEVTQAERAFWDTLTDDSATAPMLDAKLDEITTGSSSILDSWEKRIDPPNSRTYSEVKLMLKAMGVPYFALGTHEAEGVAASLVLNGRADFVASEDSDVLLYGAPLLRDVTSMGKPLRLFCSPDIPASLGLTPSAFVDFGIILGTDFSKKLKNVGPMKAIELVKEYHAIEKIIEALPELNKKRGKRTFELPAKLDEDAYMRQVAAARQIFTHLPPLPPKRQLKRNKRSNKRVIKLLARFDLVEVLRQQAEEERMARALENTGPENALAGNYFEGESPGWSWSEDGWADIFNAKQTHLQTSHSQL